MQQLIKPENPPQLIVDTLVIISQLARLHKDHYPAIQKTNILQPLKLLLQHQDNEVRAKSCNLIGNMCRHSAYFYESIQKSDILPELIRRCRDNDSNTRKFACFAIGNAGFHNDKLYEDLKPSISPLIELLSDQEEKTRANAAGALGNLVRNSGALCNDIIRQGALTKLLRTLKV